MLSSTHTLCRARNIVIKAERSADVGDVVTVRLSSDNEAVRSAFSTDEPLVFELGSKGLVGNELFQVEQTALPIRPAYACPYLDATAWFRNTSEVTRELKSRTRLLLEAAGQRLLSNLADD